MSNGVRTRSKNVKKRTTRIVTPTATHTTSRASAAQISARPSTGTAAGAAERGSRRSAVPVNQTRTQAASAELPYWRNEYRGSPRANGRPRAGTALVPQRSRCVKLSQAMWVSDPMTAER
ncbi:hypothetical protein GCM10020254_61910 [Streptomyces goshikiensis]